MKKLAVLIFVAAMGLVSCEGLGDNSIETTNNVELNTPVVEANDNNGQWVSIETAGEWSAEIQYNQGEQVWADLATTSGEGDALIRLNYTRNSQAEARTLDIVITFDNETKRATLTQSGKGGDIDPPVDNSILLEAANVPASQGSQTFTITSDMAWDAMLLFDQSVPSDWAQLDEYNGTGDKILHLTYDQNVSQNSRSVIVEVTFEDGQVLSATMTQAGVGENAVQMTTTSIPYNYTSNISVDITSEVSWTATLDYDGGTGGWANISKSSGSGNGTLQLTPTINNTEAERKVAVVVTFAGGQSIKTPYLVQGKNSTITPPVGDTPGWTEMPQVVSGANYYFVTHYAPLQNGTSARNYSLLYDATMYTAMWIAYPMSKSYATGSAGGRNETWTYDPEIPSSVQVNLKSSYGVSSDAGIYSRGHQVASSDRQSSVAQNKQTFYYTNMTPQKQDFNGVIWNYLEQNIQALAKSITDTLWCVTGPVFQTIGGVEPIKYITNKNDGKSCPVPNYYFKVIIRKSGTTYKGIGFWFGHNYNYSIPHFKDGISMTDVKTIREIEALTGINFYMNLSQQDQENAENQAVDQSFWSSLFGK